MFSTTTILTALGLTTIAGLAMVAGSLPALFTRKGNTRFLAFALGLSAGVMVYVSLMDLLPESIEMLEGDMGEHASTLWALASFFVGFGLIAVIDYLVPDAEHDRDVPCPDTDEVPCPHAVKRMGMMVAFAIGAHNFPEGAAIFVSSLHGMDIAIPIVVAVAIHNIPAGLAISAPIYMATGSRWKALGWSLATGMVEPLGALLAWAVFVPIWTAALNGILLGAVAGIMMYVAFDELLPSSRQFGHNRLAMWGVAAGMALMAMALFLFEH